MKEVTLALLGILLIISCKTTLKTPATETTDKKIYYDFPSDWIGDYEGKLYIYKSQTDTTVVDMGLSIQQPDATGLYPWILKYGNEDIRYYGLEAINVEKGHYRIDELNSIRLDAFLRGNNLITRFNVMGSDLMVDYEKTEIGMTLRFYVSQDASERTTGGEIFGQDTVPTVKTWEVPVYQEAVLRKMRNKE